MNTDIAKDELLIFLGHSYDTFTAALEVKKLENLITDELRYLDEVINFSLPFRRVKIYEWFEDSKINIGGQKKNIDPTIDRSNIAIFIFQDRVGEVTWEELERCRTQEKPTIAIFSKQPGNQNIWNDKDKLSNWITLLAKKDKLVEDWTSDVSKSIRPVTDYKDVEELKAIILKHIKQILPQFANSEKKDDEFELKDKLNYPQNLANNSQGIFTNDIVLDFERRICHGASFKDLNYELIENCYFTIYGSNNGHSIESKAERLGVFSKNTGSIINAAILCFSDFPETFIPQARSKIIGPSSTKIFQKSITGSLPTQIRKIIDICNEYIEPQEYISSDGQRKSTNAVPFEISREILSNAFTHRDYSNSSKIEVEISKRYIEVRSPGSFPQGLTWSKLINKKFKGSKPINPTIAFYLFGLGIAEEIGHGFEVIRDYMKTSGSNSIQWLKDVEDKVAIRLNLDIAKETGSKRKQDIYVSSTEKKSVNISVSSSPVGLKEDLSELASRYGMKLSTLIILVYEYSLTNRSIFLGHIENPRPKGGKHISTILPRKAADELTDWANSLGRSRAHHCAFILEKALEEKLIDKITSSNILYK